MIHTNPHDAEDVPKFHGEALEGMTGYVRHIKDNKQGFIMILIPYPKDLSAGLIHSLKHGY